MGWLFEFSTHFYSICKCAVMRGELPSHHGSPSKPVPPITTQFRGASIPWQYTKFITDSVVGIHALRRDEPIPRSPNRPSTSINSPGLHHSDFGANHLPKHERFFSDFKRARAPQQARVISCKAPIYDVSPASLDALRLCSRLCRP